MFEPNKRVALKVWLASLLGAIVVGVAATPLMTSASASGAQTYSEACRDVEAIWVRGSGESLGARTFDRFRLQVDSRIKSPVTHRVLEIGAFDVDGLPHYPAVSVKPFESFDSLTNLIGGRIFRGAGGISEYGNSVNAGHKELSTYLKKRHKKCPGMWFIVGGYSQGAQVVGESYVEDLTDAVRDRIVFNILMGDPKLWLPEGVAQKKDGWIPWWETPACKGEEFSTWRREVPNCKTDNGSLRARKPYLPWGWISSTGLWCNDKDFICGASKNPLSTAAHSTYAEPGGAVDQGVEEAVQHLNTSMLIENPPPFPSPTATPRPGGGGDSDGRVVDGLDVSRILPQGGASGLDVLIVVDSTGSMRDDIDDAKRIATELNQFIADVDGRVALVEYRDAGDEFAARVLSGLDDDAGSFLDALETIEVDGGGDIPEALLHALTVGMKGVEWRDGATKAAIVLTDAPYHDPDQVDGSTLEEVAALSLSIDPVNVYPVVPAAGEVFYTPLAEATTGQVIVNNEGSAAALTEALSRIKSRPVVKLRLNAYYANAGESIRFNGSRSYSPTSEIVKWDWDFDGDGDFEIVDGDQIATHAYPPNFEGFVQLRVTDADGLVANHSVPVYIDYHEETLTPATSVRIELVGDGNSAHLTWEATEDPPRAWAISIEGFEVAYAEPDARLVTINDLDQLDRTKSLVFGVAPFSDDLGLGPDMVAYLDPDATVQVTPQPATGSATPQPGSASDPGGSGPGASSDASQAAETGSDTDPLEAEGPAATPSAATSPEVSSQIPVPSGEADATVTLVGGWSTREWTMLGVGSGLIVALLLLVGLILRRRIG